MGPRHPPVYPSLEQLLAPESLARTTGRAVAGGVVRRVALAGGLSGARIERVWLAPDAAAAHADAPAAGEVAYILKLLDPQTNWLMRASGDSACRELSLTQSPLWARLPPAIWVPVLACARLAGGAGALLLPDLGTDLLSAAMSYAAADDALLARIVEGLAALHATFWQDSALRRASWLASPADALLALTPARLAAARAGTRQVGAVEADATGSAAQPGPTDALNYPTSASQRWAHLPRLLAPDDAAAIQRVITAPERIIAALHSAPATLVHGDPWLANLGMRDGRLILLDWALCTAGPATFDSLWLANTWRALDPAGVLALHRAALARHGVAAVADDALWALLCDLGWVRSTLMGVESLVDDVERASGAGARAAALARLRRWCGRAAAIVRTRGW